MHFNKIILILLITGMFSIFCAFEVIRKSDFAVLNVVSANKIEVDLNGNNIYDAGETICIPDIETFTSDLKINQSNLLNSVKISAEDGIKLGYLTDNFADNTLSDRRVRLKFTGIENSECKFADIITDNQSYRKKLVNSGFAFNRGTPLNNENYVEQLKKARKLKLVILNHKSNKYHKLDCKYGLIAHDAIVVPAQQIPEDAKPCKFCHITKTRTFLKKNKQYVEKLLTYPLAISNGSLIDQKIIEKVYTNWHIHSIQITLDGYDSTYDQIKNYYNPITCNFKKVIEAIKLLSKSGIKTAIRMNYDTKNYQSLVELIEFLHIELSGYKKLIYYVFPVWSSTDEHAENSYSSTTTADMNLLSLFDLLVKYRMNTIKAIARLNYKAHACQAWNLHSYAILPNGDIAKCCESYNQVIGSVTKGITDIDTYNFWTTSILEEKCDSCSYLPLCQGGCKSSYFNRMPHCFAFKPIINEILKWYVSYLDNQCK